MQTKLTIRVNRELIQSAKHYAARHQISLSQLVENYFKVLSASQNEPVEQTPLLNQLSGILPADASMEEHRRHLDEKYG